MDREETFFSRIADVNSVAIGRNGATDTGDSAVFFFFFAFFFFAKDGISGPILDR